MPYLRTGHLDIELKSVEEKTSVIIFSLWKTEPGCTVKNRTLGWKAGGKDRDQKRCQWP